MVRPGDENLTIFLHERPKKNQIPRNTLKNKNKKNGDNLRESLPWNKEAKKEKYLKQREKKKHKMTTTPSQIKSRKKKKRFILI